LIYRPDGQEEQRWEFHLGQLRTKETEGIEKRTGLAYDTEFREALLKGAIRARRALLWTFQRRQHHNLLFDDVDFAADELVVEMDRGELQEAREAIAKNTALPDEERTMALAVLDQQIAEADAKAEAQTPEELGKAPESIGVADTP
jgi:hypothetical protein